MNVDKRIAFCFALTAVFIAVAIPVHNRFVVPEPIYSAIVKLERMGKSDIVIVGNSHSFYGINAGIIGYALNRNVMNFSFEGLKYGNEVYYNNAEECLNENSSVRTMVLNIDPHAFRKWDTPTNYYDVLNMSPLKRRVKKFFAGNFSLYSDEHSVYLRDADFFILRDNFTQFRKDNYIRSYCKGFFSDFDNARWEGFLEHVRKWHDKGITVVGIRVPMDKAATDCAMKYMTQNKLIEQFEDAGGIWVDVPGEYETVDGSHLTGESAFRYSEALAKELKKVTDENPNR